MAAEGFLPDPARGPQCSVVGVTPTRVLYVEGCRDGTVGGSHMSLYAMVAHLDRHRFEPYVVFYDDHAVAERIRELGANVQVLPNRSPLDLRTAFENLSPRLRLLAVVLGPLQKAANFARVFLVPAVEGALYLRRHAIDLVHLNNSINGNHDWMLAARLARVPYVSHERGVSARLSRTARFFAGAASGMVCISRAIRETLVRQGVPEATTVVVYNGVDPGAMGTGGDAARLKAELGIAQGDPVIGVVGNVKRWKGQDTVVRATARLRERWPRIRCLIVGATGVDPDFDTDLAALRDDLGLGASVIFTGFRGNPADFIAIMDVVVHSSIESEPFGRVNIEAMCLGKPVVATNIGGPTEIFEDGVDGVLVEPGNAEVLAQQAGRLLESPELRRRLGENARATVMRRFTIDATMRGIEHVYERALGRSNRRAR